MGTVRVERAGGWYFNGDLITQSVVCIYCDKCGSFRISRRLTLKAIISVAVVALIVYAIRDVTNKDKVVFGVLCFTILLFWADLFFHVLKLGYWCKQCGNIHITDNDNVLDYPYYDKDILDLPLKKTINFIADDY